MRIIVPVFILIAIAVGAGWYAYGYARGPTYMQITVQRGAVAQEVLATGNLQPPTTSNLFFEAPGKLAALNVHVGETVVSGQVLAKQSASVLEAELAQAQASVSAATANLNQLLSGATPQSVGVSQAQVSVAKQQLQNAYAEVPSTLADAYSKANDAVTTQLANFFTSASTANPELTFVVSNAALTLAFPRERVSAGQALAAWTRNTALLDSASTPAVLDSALSSALSRLDAVHSFMNDAVTVVADSNNLSSAQAAAYRLGASTGLSETNAAISEVRALMNTIALAKATLDQTQSQLALTTATSTTNNIAATQAMVREAQANASAIEAQIRNDEIVAPFNGVVTDTHGSVGEVVGPGRTIISLIPLDPLEVKANVSEDDIVGVAVGDSVRIGLYAFPSTDSFYGKVTEIDPAETIVDGSVYYTTTILFDKSYPNLRSGMTANVWIATASSTNALLVPASALAQTGTTTTVMRVEGRALIPQVVTTGIVGQDGMIEITSGLTQGEALAVPK